MLLEMLPRTAWGDFPDVVIHAAESVVKQHPAYAAAKAGESDVLTGKPYSAKLRPTNEQLALLRAKHGHALEIWWQQRFGHNFDCLTQSEARYLERSPDADTIRNRLAAAEQAGDRGAFP